MSSPARRVVSLLRQHFVLLCGPWLGVCAVSFLVWKTVQQATNWMFPMVDLRSRHGAGYADTHTLLATTYTRLGAVECAFVLGYALKIVALALTILLATQVASYGADTFSGAMERLRKVPAATSTLLKLFLLVLAIGFGTTLIATVPVLLYVPWQAAHGGLHAFVPFPRWATTLSYDVGRLIFACCIMPFFLDFVAHFEQQASRGEDARRGLLGRAIGYGVVALLAEVALGLLMRSLRTQLAGVRGTGVLILQWAIGLAAELVTALPTIVCVVAIALMMMRTGEPVTDAEPA